MCTVFSRGTVVRRSPVFSHDSNFVHREFKLLCQTKEYVVEHCSTSEKVVVALGEFRPHNFQFVAERLSGSFPFGDLYYIFSAHVVVSIQKFEY